MWTTEGKRTGKNNNFWWLVSKLLKLICTATVVVIVSGVQLGLRSTIRHHPPQRAVLRQICCFEIVRWCCFRSCCTVLSHVMRGRPGCLLQSAGEEVNRILLASALSSMRIICPNRVCIYKMIAVLAIPLAVQIFFKMPSKSLFLAIYSLFMFGILKF